MKDLLQRLWRDEDGAEIAEWLFVVAFLLVAAGLLFNDVLLNAMTGVMDSIVAALENAPN